MTEKKATPTREELIAHIQSRISGLTKDTTMGEMIQGCLSVNDFSSDSTYGRKNMYFIEMDREQYPSFGGLLIMFDDFTEAKQLSTANFTFFTPEKDVEKLKPLIKEQTIFNTKEPSYALNLSYGPVGYDEPSDAVLISSGVDDNDAAVLKASPTEESTHMVLNGDVPPALNELTELKTNSGAGPAWAGKFELTTPHVFALALSNPPGTPLKPVVFPRSITISKPSK
jgi:hypothetical protein